MNRSPASISPLTQVENGQAAREVQEVGQEVTPGASSSKDVPVLAEGEDEQVGERIPKLKRCPDMPTKARMAEHYPLHAHYRSWCPHCQAGLSIRQQHRREREEDDQIGPSISIDYAFKYDDEIEEGVDPVLVVVDKGSGSIWALEVDGKGAESQTGVEWLETK